MMKVVNRGLTVMAAASIATIFVGAACGATISYGPTSFGNPFLFSAGDSGNFTFPQFDPAMGTLFQVDLEVTGNSTGGSNGLQNLSANPGNASVTIGTDITVAGPATLTVLTLPNSNTSGPVAPFSGAIDFTFSGPDSVLIVGTPASDTQSDSIIAGLAPYIGLGNVSFNYSSNANTSNSADVSPTFSSTTAPAFDFTATVTYHYNPVPEPGTLALAGLAAMGLATCVVRRRAR